MTPRPENKRRIEIIPAHDEPLVPAPSSHDAFQEAPRSSPQTLTAARLLTRFLQVEGVKHVFGIPGGPIMPLYEALSETKTIQPILTKHEEGAAFMADGYARVRQGLGVCALTSGPGATNAVTGVAVSYEDGIPILVLTAQVATTAFGRGALQESTNQSIDVVELFKPITKASMMLIRSDKMGEMVRYLLRVALNGRQGPIHLNIPADLANKEARSIDIPTASAKSTNNFFDRESVKRAADLLIHAKHPAMLVGGGIISSGAYEEVRRLAEKLQIPTATTAKAKGAFPENHVLSLGVFGFAGSPQADAYLLSGEVDVLLAVATSLGEDATNGWDARLAPKEALLHINIDPQQIGSNYPAHVSLVGDAKTVLKEMLFQVERETHWIDVPGRTLDQMREFHRSVPRFVDEEKMTSNDMPLKPQRLLKDLGDVLPENAIVFTDIGHHMAFAFHYLKINRPHSFFHCLGFASMGHGTAACIGAKLAAPNRPVIAIVGDASFAMNGMEVHTACDYNIPVIWLVFNNGGNGMVYHGEKIQFGGRFHNSLYSRPIDIFKLGEALGAASYRVTRPGELCKVMERALADNRPTVIDAVISVDEVPPIGSRFKALNQFFDGSNSK